MTYAVVRTLGQAKLEAVEVGANPSWSYNGLELNRAISVVGCSE